MNLRNYICSFLHLWDQQSCAKFVSRGFRATCNEPRVLYPELKRIVATLSQERDEHPPRHAPAKLLRPGDTHCGSCGAAITVDARNLIRLRRHGASPRCAFCPALDRVHKLLASPTVSNKQLLRVVLWVHENHHEDSTLRIVGRGQHGGLVAHTFYREGPAMNNTTTLRVVCGLRAFSSVGSATIVSLLFH